MVFSIEGAVIAQSVCRENLCDSLKTTKLFSHVAFVIYGMLCVCCLCVFFGVYVVLCSLESSKGVQRSSTY